MEHIEIDLVALEDRDAEFTRRLVREIKHADSTDPQPFLDSDDGVAYAATDGDTPVAWAYGYILNRPDGHRMMLLYEMEVSPTYRRRGIGRRLVSAFRDRAIEEGCRTMWLITDDDNVSAQMLYQLEGATAEGTRLQYAWRQLQLD